MRTVGYTSIDQFYAEMREEEGWSGRVEEIADEFFQPSGDSDADSLWDAPDEEL